MERSLKKLLKNGNFQKVPPIRSRTMSRIRGKNNKSTEIQFRMLLIRNKIAGWTTNEVSLIGKPDFYFKKGKMALFIDGCFWHGCPVCGHIPRTNTAFWKEKIKRNKLRDKRTKKALLKQGIKVLRLWEHQIKNPKAINLTIKTIKKFL
jgi:DNA mismatch endonuclease, patch repair protein